MNLKSLGWMVGGLAALGLGMAAEACSSSNNGSTIVDGGGTGATSGGGGCTALSACCMMLSGSDATMCDGVVTAANDGNCTNFLGQIQKDGLCLGAGTTTSSGVSGVTGVSTATTATGVSGVTGVSNPTGTSVSSVTTATTGGGGTSAGDAGCEKPPEGPFAETTAGVYCPFGTPPAGKTSLYCPAMQTCCEPTSGTSTCQASSTCATGDTAWTCGAPIDCGSGMVCCGNGTVETQAPCGTYPAFAYASEFKGTSCAASCGAMQFEVCGASTDCPSGMTCVAIKAKGNDFGYCM
jgi:hypothetical protein